MKFLIHIYGHGHRHLVEANCIIEVRWKLERIYKTTNLKFKILEEW